MGIKGCHNALKHYVQEVAVLEDYVGHRIGCDVSSWIRKSVISSAWDIEINPNTWKERGLLPPWVSYSLDQIERFRHHNIELVLVFDGQRHPAKACTHEEREQKRQSAREEAQRLFQQGEREKAEKKLRQAVEVTPAMVRDLILVLRKKGVEFYVAPYEADAQLAYLAKLARNRGGVDAILTEDSDFLAYGCPVMLFKLAFKDDTWTCNELTMERVFAGPPDRAPAGTLNFKGWNHEKLTTQCVVAGCDYAKSVHGVSFKTAHKLITQGQTLNGSLEVMRRDRKFASKVTREYEENARRALNVFQYAVVYDIHEKKCVHLNALPAELASLPDEDLHYLGPKLHDDVACQLASGDLNPHTLSPFSEAVEGTHALSPAPPPAPATASRCIPARTWELTTKYFGSRFDPIAIRRCCAGRRQPHTPSHHSAARSRDDQGRTRCAVSFTSLADIIRH